MQEFTVVAPRVELDGKGGVMRIAGARGVEDDGRGKGLLVWV